MVEAMEEEPLDSITSEDNADGVRELLLQME